MGFFSELFKKISRGKEDRDSAQIKEEKKRNGGDYNNRTIEDSLTSTRESKQISGDSIMKNMIECQSIEMEIVEPDMPETKELDTMLTDENPVKQVEDDPNSSEEKLPFFIRYHIDLETYGDAPVTTLSMPQRLTNVLESNGYQTIRAFLELSEDDISAFKHSGTVTVNEAINLAQAIAKGEVEKHTENVERFDIEQEKRYCDRYGIDSGEYDHLSLDAVRIKFIE